MPQSSYAYAVARIRALEKGLIGQEKMSRMADSSLEDALRMLQEAGYGDMPEATAMDAEAMIAKERVKASELVREISPAPAVTDLFLLQADVHNLKVLLKARLLHLTEEPPLMQGGVYPAELMQAAVREGNYRDLPVSFSDALTALEKQLQAKENPQAVSIALDKAYLTHAYATLAGNKNDFALSYFKGLADFNNVLSLLRLRDMGAEKETLAVSLLPAGDIPHSTLVAAFDQPFDMLIKMVSTGPCGSVLSKGLEEVQRCGRTGSLEKMRDNYLMELAKKGKYETMTLHPILGYLLAREQEAKSIRLILTAKRNGLAASVISERLRELYG